MWPFKKKCEDDWHRIGKYYTYYFDKDFDYVFRIFVLEKCSVCNKIRSVFITGKTFGGFNSYWEYRKEVEKLGYVEKSLLAAMLAINIPQT